MTLGRTLIVLALIAGAVPACAADPKAGKALFRSQCALCHSAEPDDNGGAQGPDLHNVFGRPAATGDFSYTKALKNSGLTWDAATLDRFLSSPTTVVPGSAMVVSVPKKEDRDNLVAYFQAVKEGTFEVAPPRPRGLTGAAVPLPVVAKADPPKGEADWKKDAPGVVHKIDLDRLDAPFDTPSANNFPRLVPRPEGAEPKVPAGFKVEVFASDLSGPRAMRVAPNGDIFFTEPGAGKVRVMRPSKDGARADTIETFAQGLMMPFGVQFYPPGDHPQWVYIAETNRVVRYPYRIGDLKATAVPEIVVAELSPVGGGHYTRDVNFSLDGKRMFVSVGSQGNVAEDMPKKTPAEVKAWEAEHGLGAAWGNEENRASVRVFEVGSNKPGRTFATGLRNCVGLTIQPKTGTLWCTVNERDRLGDNLVPDYSTPVKEGGFYGWPWYYMGNHEDPRLKGDRPDLAGRAVVPDVPYQAHSAALNLVFYDATSGASVFPKEYWGEGFAVLHGSWNRAFRTGHKVVRVRMKDGKPTGEYQDFMTGFITEDGNAWARPVGAAVAKDGSLLISDDGANLIYRISTAATAIMIPGERLVTESLTSTKDGSVIVGSVMGRTIFRAKPGADTAQAWISPGTDGMGGIYGVFADDKSNTLWACSAPSMGGSSGDAAQSPTLHAFDLGTGAPKGKYGLPTPRGFCNDIAVDADGNAYVTDSNNMQVLRLKKGAKALEVWSAPDAFGPMGGVLDGIAVLGDRVFTNTLGTSKLWATPIGKGGKAGATVEVKLDTPLERPDGMRSFGSNSLLVAEGGGGGKLSKVSIDGDSGRRTVLKEGFPDNATAVTVVGTTAYVIEAQFMSMRPPTSDGAQPPPKPFKATAVEMGNP